MTERRDERLLVVIGPTGTGKSALGLALAERLGGEIVGCDALQVYQGLDAATAKPSVADRRRVPHHLIDCADPRRDFSLADYVDAAEEAIAGIVGRGRTPIVVGGTGLYLRGLLCGVVRAPPRDERLRGRLRSIIDRGGAARLRRLLERKDPASAARIAPADTQRTIRALEIALSGVAWSERIALAGGWGGATERYASLKVGLDRDREALAGALDQRVCSFFDAGLATEVRTLLARGVSPSANAFKGIGYRETLLAIRDDGNLDRARAEAQRSTRRYAKRQRSWFRKEPNVAWLDAALGTERLAEEVLRAWSRRDASEAMRPPRRG